MWKSGNLCTELVHNPFIEKGRFPKLRLRDCFGMTPQPPI